MFEYLNVECFHRNNYKKNSTGGTSRDVPPFLFMSVPGVLQAPIRRPPSLFTIKTKKRIQRCAALYPQNNRSVTDVGTLPTSFQPKTFRFFALQIYKLFLYRSCDLLFFSHIPIDVSHQTGGRNNREIVVICLFCRRLFDKIEHFLLTLSEFRLRHVSVMISDILGVGRGKN